MKRDRDGGPIGTIPSAEGSLGHGGEEVGVSAFHFAVATLELLLTTSSAIPPSPTPPLFDESSPMALLSEGARGRKVDFVLLPAGPPAVDHQRQYLCAERNIRATHFR